jgi:transposase InsO family protein
MDYFTKWPLARAVTNQNAATVADFIFQEIICQFGCPKKIQTDNGTPFRNQWIPELTKRFGFRHLFVTAYHPQSNGLVERFNRTLGTALAKYAHNDKTSWDKHLHGVLYAYRTTRQSSTRFSPFQLTYGLPGRLPVDLE